MTIYADDFNSYQKQGDTAQIMDVLNIRGVDGNGKSSLLSALASIDLVTASSYTPKPSDNGKIKVLTDATAVAVALPVNAPKGFAIRFVQGGAGPITVSAASGAIRSANGVATSAQWSGFTAVVIDQAGDGQAATWLVG